jgi:ADP-heptose:LPS heptosyltransferase
LAKGIQTYFGILKRRIQIAIEAVLFKPKSLFVRKNTLLLLRMDSIGDYILFRNFIPVLRESERFKHFEITLCGNSWWKDLAEELDGKYVNKFVWIDYHRMKEFGYRFRMYRKLRRMHHEVLLHPTFSRDYTGDHLVVHSGIRKTIGHDGDFTNLSPEQKIYFNAAYSELVPAKKNCEFEFYRNRDFFEGLFCSELANVKLQIDYPSGRENKIIICPGAKDSFRRWSTVNFADLCDRLGESFPGFEFVICGAAEDTVFAAEIMTDAKTRFTDLTGKLDLVQLVAEFATAKLVITNDSGPFHIAAALTKKVVCISNGNNYGRFSPYPGELAPNVTVLYPEALLQLSERERLEKYCRNGCTLNINSITVSKVIEAIHEKSALNR